MPAQPCLPRRSPARAKLASRSRQAYAEADFPDVAASSKRESQHRSENFDVKFRILSKSNFGSYM
eukprot:4898484-Pleurochrysis_carterae.AAC.1